MKKTVLMLAAVSVSAAVSAQTAQEVVKKAYLAESYSPYATPELKKLMTQAGKVAEKVDPDTACEMFEHYALGLGNGGAPDDLARTLTVKPLRGNVYRASFKDLDGRRKSADITVLCRNGKCLIDDVEGMKAHYRKVVKTRSCGY